MCLRLRRKLLLESFAVELLALAGTDPLEPHGLPAIRVTVRPPRPVRSSAVARNARMPRIPGDCRQQPARHRDERCSAALG